jgi:hypothetical protein
MDLVISTIESNLGIMSVPQDRHETTHYWALSHPLNNFITSYHFNLTHQHFDQQAKGGTLPPPKLSLISEKLDTENGIRELTLQCYHPNHISTIIHFEAELAYWSLSEPPEKGHQRQIITFVSGYGSNVWTATFGIKDPSLGAKKNNKIKFHVGGMERDANEKLESWESAGARRKKVGGGVYSHGWLRWVWNEEYEAGKVLKKVEDALPEWTTSGHRASITVVVDI